MNYMLIIIDYLPGLGWGRGVCGEEREGAREMGRDRGGEKG